MLARVVITGGPRAFSAGADVTEMRGQDPAAILDYYRATGAVYERVAALPQPTIAAIAGWCLGGGLELALACDFRVAEETAQFGLPEVRIGILPSSGGTHRLARLVGAARAKELVLLRERIGAADAAAFGLVTEVVADGGALDRALALARDLADASAARRRGRQAGARRHAGGLTRGRPPRRAPRLRPARADGRRPRGGRRVHREAAAALSGALTRMLPARSPRRCSCRRTAGARSACSGERTVQASTTAPGLAPPADRPARQRRRRGSRRTRRARPARARCAGATAARPRAAPSRRPSSRTVRSLNDWIATSPA